MTAHQQPAGRLPWTVDALCAEYPHELWFPESKGKPAREAKAICARCPVQVQCLDLALAYESGALHTEKTSLFGVWGGLSPKQRAKLRRDAEEPAA